MPFPSLWQPAPLPDGLTSPSSALLEEWLRASVPSLVQAAIAVFITILALRFARNWLWRALTRARVDVGTRILIRRGASIVIVVTGLITILGIFGVSLAALLTLLGAVGLALSLAAQDILKNFFSGVYLLLERPFRVGDRIKVKDQFGTVENVGVRTTTLRTEENVQILVPNAVVFAEVVSNFTYAFAPEAESIADGPDEADAADRETETAAAAAKVKGTPPVP